MRILHTHMYNCMQRNWTNSNWKKKKKEVKFPQIFCGYSRSKFNFVLLYMHSSSHYINQKLIGASIFFYIACFNCHLLYYWSYNMTTFTSQLVTIQKKKKESENHCTSSLFFHSKHTKTLWWVMKRAIVITCNIPSGCLYGLITSIQAHWTEK